MKVIYMINEMKNAELPTKGATCEEGSNWIVDVSTKMTIIELE